MWISLNGQRLDASAEHAALCSPLGITFASWAVDQLDPDLCRQAAKNAEFGQQIIDFFAGPLAKLKAEGGYLTEDIVCLSSETPNLQTLLAMFDTEHHHTDDEVRAVLYGEGVFGIVPPDSEPFEIHVEAGDLLVVPAYTRHWFTLTDRQEIVAMRIFKTPDGWTAIYESPALA